MAAGTVDGPVVAPRVGMFAALRINAYVPVFIVGALWNVSRWGLMFLGAYVVNARTGSPRLVQFTGVAMWSPLLVGGVLGGVVSDRFDRRRTIGLQLCVLVPLVAALGIAELAGGMRLWLLYPAMVVIGVGWVVDMTSRRALVYDIVGQERVANAMALEALSISIGMALGTLAGGSAIQAIGVGKAYLIIAGLLAGALIALVQSPRIARSTPAADATSPLAALRDGFALLGRHRTLVSILGVTAAVNFFFFSFNPLIQVLAKRMGVGAAATGLLASMIGGGMMVSSLFIARFRPRRQGLLYAGGSVAGMLLLAPMALIDLYPAALAVLLAAATGLGLFGALQATIVMQSVPDEVRGRALGLLSTAIGMLPPGMIALGELAEAVGAPAAIAGFAVAGTVLLALWLWRWPEVLAVRS